MQQPAEMASHHEEDPASELTELRATDAQLRDELADVRRQRDEAITQAQWLITRVTNAEQAVEALQAELAAARPTGGPDPVEPRVDVEASQPAGMVIPRVAGEKAVGHLIGVVVEPTGIDLEPTDSADSDSEADEAAEVGRETIAEPVADDLPATEVLAGSWAGQAGPWLPPEDVDHESTAHEFAALTERALIIEAEEAERAAAEIPPQVTPMDVLPATVGEAKKPSLFRRR